MGPLLVKAIITFSKTRIQAKQDGAEVPNVGRGIGMAIGLFFLIVMASVCQHQVCIRAASLFYCGDIDVTTIAQYFYRSMATGVLARAALISSIYKRVVNLTPKSKSQFPNSSIMTFVSTDVSVFRILSWTLVLKTLFCRLVGSMVAHSGL